MTKKKAVTMEQTGHVHGRHITAQELLGHDWTPTDLDTFPPVPILKQRWDEGAQRFITTHINGVPVQKTEVWIYIHPKIRTSTYAKVLQWMEENKQLSLSAALDLLLNLFLDSKTHK